MDIDRFIEVVSRIVGNANVITDERELERYSRDHSFVKPAMPSCMVRPGDVEEVQEVLIQANKYLIPITPLSGGTNNLGGTIPSPSGVILDLRRMDKILDIDERAQMASIQPGVTFENIQRYVSKYGLRVLTPVELPKISSTLSTYLDLVPLYGWVFYGEEILTTMTVILPDGTLVKTGQQALPLVSKPYTHSHGVPFAGLLSYIWYQSQGTLGVVVQGWIKLKPLGEAEEVVFIPLNRSNEVYQVVREIMWLRYPRDMFILNRTDAALFFADGDRDYENKVDSLRDILPEWLIIFILRHRRDAIDVMFTDLKERIVDKLGLKLLLDLPEIEKASEKVRLEILYPSGWPKYSKYRGARTILPFISSLKDLPTIQQVLDRVSKKYRFSSKNIGITTIPTDRIGVAAYNIAFMRSLDDDNEYINVKKLYYEVAEELLKLGVFYSRPYGILAKLMYSKASNYYQVLMKIKRMLDPNNIMNPRRLSIYEEW